MTDAAMPQTGASPIASVIVTNYNYAQHVGAAIDSALAQQGGAVEVIVVDDGSTDESVEVIERYGNQVRLIEQPNGGQGSAFNTGFAASSAEIVIFLDADDVLAPDLVDRLSVAFADTSIARVQFRLSVIDFDGAPTGQLMPPADVELASGDVGAQLTTFPDDITWQPTSGNAFRRSVLDQILPMPTADYRICADYYLSNLTPVHGSVAVLDGVGGSYRVHDANGHFTTAWTLDAIRANIVRTSITHRHLITECRHAGLSGLPDDPDAVRSVTALAHRIVSLRLDPDEHPITTDRPIPLAWSGVRASFGRFDAPVTRRLTYAGWFVLAALAPRALVRRVATPFISVAA